MPDTVQTDSCYQTKSEEIMGRIAVESYSTKDDQQTEKTHAGQYAMENCIELFKLDYDVELINNITANMCSHYPSQIILMGEKDGEKSSIKGPKGEDLTLREARDQLEAIMKEAATSRCRSRFVAPVIYYNGQYICRSATVASAKELAMNMSLELAEYSAETVKNFLVDTGSLVWRTTQGFTSYTSSFLWGGKQEETEEKTEGNTEEKTEGNTEEKTDGNPEEKTEGNTEEKTEGNAEGKDSGTEPSGAAASANPPQETDKNAQDGVDEPDENERTAFWSKCYSYMSDKITMDKKLLHKLNVLNVCDLMVEDAKVKYGFSVSSSEKADERYADFQLLSLPYPGCEFFAEWKEKKQQTSNLYYNWEDSLNNAPLKLDGLESVLESMDIDWSEYTKWDLGTLTANYLRLIIRLIALGKHGLLVHCISGWDRTPLFISLLRISLWADGVIHKSLRPCEMMYLTLAYDWYLFGHQYQERVKRGEMILHFCFHILVYLVKPEFSIHYGMSPRKLLPGKEQASAKNTVKTGGKDGEHRKKQNVEGSPAQPSKKDVTDKEKTENKNEKSTMGEYLGNLCNSARIGGDNLNINGADEIKKNGNVVSFGKTHEKTSAGKPTGGKPAEGEAATGGEPAGDELDEILLANEFENINTPEKFNETNERKKRLFAVSYAFSNCLAKCESKTLPQASAFTQIVDTFVYSSVSGVKLAVAGIDSMFKSMFSFGSNTAQEKEGNPETAQKEEDGEEDK